MKYALLFIVAGFSLAPLYSTAQTKSGKSNAPTDSLKLKQGEKIFKRNCSTCHNFEKKLIAAPLKNVLSRHSKEWIFEYISDDSEFMKKDTTARSINKQGDNTWVTSHNFKNAITKKDFDKLIYYFEKRKK
jgi:cytochrome c2